MSLWRLDHLKSKLSRKKEIKSWIVSTEHLERRERYFMQEMGKGGLVVDQDRDVEGEAVFARIFVDIGKEGRQGEIVKRFFKTLSLDEQIDSAVQSAQQTDHEVWTMPTALPESVPEVKSYDPKIREDLESVMRELTNKIGEEVLKKRKASFNSSELFISNHTRELHFHHGGVHRSNQSRIYLEAAYSGKKDEYLSRKWAVGLEDLSVHELFEEAAERSLSIDEVVKTPGGVYPVLVDHEVSGLIMNDAASWMSGANVYMKFPHRNVGDDWVTGAKGDLITMSLDPTLGLMADTSALSNSGALQTFLKLIEKNKVKTWSTDNQYAQYLKTVPTSVRGSVVVSPGSTTKADMLKKYPKVLEILQFSALFTQPTTGTFSSEIRLGLLYENGKPSKFVKGGSLSGSLFENFTNATFSKELVKHNEFESGFGFGTGGGRAYYGPAFMLLNDVSVAG
ncbi:MAG: hypothetical protein KA715_10000 [Xanthomonadaceae bacterium]|nr:hypothetical protein [Xanthomonadaceae bacterium]